MSNVDLKTIEGFSAQWMSFDQASVPSGELRKRFEEFFELFPWKQLPNNAVGFDLGCGTGRWAKFVAPRVSKLHLIDASDAIVGVAKNTLRGMSNCEFHVASVDRMPIEDGGMDFGYALGVFHYLPDPVAALKSCVAKLKPNAPFLLYVYYALDNRPAWYRTIWRLSDAVRKAVAQLPYWAKYVISTGIALLVYWPLARLSAALARLGANVEAVPLSFYRDKSLYAMRTDSLDRFGNHLEHRFTAKEVEQMMTEAGLERIEVSRHVYWCAVGYKRA